MTKAILLLLFSINVITAAAQTNKERSIPTTKQSDTTAVYRLFPTQNTWTFIKLNTRNGKMWQVQFGMNRDRRFVVSLSPEALITTDLEVNGRFTLCPTQNIYTFILIDQVDGRTWQVQWSTDADSRGIMEID